MQLLTGIFFLLISLLARAEGIYVEVDEDGVPTYSDQRTPDSIEIEIRQPMTYSDTVVQERLQQKSQRLSMSKRTSRALLPERGLRHEFSMVYCLGSGVVQLIFCLFWIIF